MSKSLPQIIQARAGARPGDHPALIDGATGEVVTYSALAARIDGIAAGLAARGLGPGDVLALAAPNSPRWAEVALGAMAAGVTVTGADPLATERELATQVADSGAALVVTDPADVAAAPGPPPAIPYDPGAVALLPYSSGTTGLPKGVMITHRNVAAALRQLAAMLRFTPADRTLAVAPFFHATGFFGTLAAPLAARATVVTMARFDLEAFLRLIERHRVTVLIVVPPVMTALARHPLVDRHDLSSLQFVLSGGAPLPADTHRAVAARLPHAAIAQGYGMTEATLAIAAGDRASGSLPGSVGRAVPETELRIVDGEIHVRGPQVTPGYHNRPDATAELIDADGWLHTGDAGSIDGDGNLFVTDRLKELIKVSGHQVAPAELEALLLAHAGVADAAVVARPDPERGEVPVAVVVPRGELDRDHLIGWVAERVAPYKRLRDVVPVERLARTPSGKLLRRRLAELV